MIPIFIFSLPRSGSTLLQKIITTHKEVYTTSETWLLLPIIYSMKESGAYAEYSHRGVNIALTDFINQLKNKESDFNQEINQFVKNLYIKSTDGNYTYFIDKTPRYSLICEEIINIFPEAKFIFLWRNPLSIISSIIETWGKGTWNIYNYKVDLYKGLDNLIKTYNKYDSNSFSLNYETLIRSTNSTLFSLFEHLNLEYNEITLDQFNSVSLSGKYGDKKGYKKFNGLSDESLSIWKNTLQSPIRKLFVKNYINWLGHENLKLIGYDKSELLEQLINNKSSYSTLTSDIYRSILHFISPWLEYSILKDKIKSKNKYRLAHQ